MFIPNVLKQSQIFGIKRNISTVLSLVKELLGNQNDTDISMMTAFRK
jgi:hypothetical protein